MNGSRRDTAESIRQRIRNRMRERGEDVQFGLQRYAAERFLYRLGVSKHRETLVLKGAALFALWGGDIYRPTRDLDFTGFGENRRSHVVAIITEICLAPCEPEALRFDPATIRADEIRDDSEYSGFRVRFDATLGTSRIPIQIDIGFGNAIQPSPTEADYPTLLGDPAPRIRTYPREAVVAEKLHAMAVLGDRNSRYKDFYDLHALAKSFAFDGESLGASIAATFERRGWPIEAAPPRALTPAFFADEARAGQWRAYLSRNALVGCPTDFDVIGELLRGFLLPPWNALARGAAHHGRWNLGGPWTAVRESG